MAGKKNPFIETQAFVWHDIETYGRHLFQYNLKEYKFIDEIAKWFNCANLSQIHEMYDANFDVLTFETDQATIFHKKFYSMPHDSEFYAIYKSFIKNKIQSLFNEEIIYQRIPTFRTQVPNNLSVAEWHKDDDYNHDKHEWNIFLPLTKAQDTNTVWAESKPGKEDYTPMDAMPGDYYLWSGSTLLHGNQLNDTGISRVSIDFRVMPLSKYKENNRISTSNHTKMTLGHYWVKIHEEQK